MTSRRGRGGDTIIAPLPVLAPFSVL